MPSRPLPPPPPPPHLRLPLRHRLLLPLLPAASLLLTLFIVACLYFSFLLRRRRSPTLPSEFPAAALRRFSYGGLRSATAGFDPSRLLGRGASASVYRGVLPSGKSVAVKLIAASPSSSPASDLEFRNELRVLSSLRPSPFVVSLLGYCDRRRRRLLVYEYLSNGSLQEALFGPSSPPSSLGWDRRFQIILDVADGLRFLHLGCDPPVVHGDVKPSNVLLGPGFRAKIADFGLARPKVDGAGTPTPPPPPPGADDELSQDLGFSPSQELGPVSPRQADFEFEFLRAGKASFEGGRVRCNPIASLEDEAKVKGKEAAVAPLDGELEGGKVSNGGDWWWKQEGSGELSSGDYVREWIGSQICPSSGDPNWPDGEEKKSDPDEARAAKPSFVVVGGPKRKKQEGCAADYPCAGGAKEWWKEEHLAEMSKKQKCSKGINWVRKASNSNAHNLKIDRGSSYWGRRRKKRRSKSVGSEMFSGDLFSRELSSTATSMRGTICYVAPEHGGCGRLMEKTDIYSFGVLVLVIVSGRRPLHVLSSPMKLERANLVGWCRQLASAGDVLDLVDEGLRGCFDKEQASLCINLALSCLQKAPELRPDSGEVVRILRGEMDLPVAPLDSSPSPNSRVSSKRRKAIHDPE